MATINELENQLSTLAQNVTNNDLLTLTTNIEILMPVQDYTEMHGRARQYFIADDDYEITAIRAVHNIQQTSADGAALMVSKCTGTTAPTAATLHLITDTAFSGDDNVYSGFNLKGIAAHTVTDCTLTNQVSSLTLTAGDRLVYGCMGTLSTQSITLVTTLKRI